MSMSNRARRMAQHHARHKADAELNLIPLIDILSVMVAFLLVYSTEVEVIQNTKGIEVPQSIAQAQPKESVVVMITKDQLFVQGELVANVADIKASTTPLVEALREKLKAPRIIGDIGEKDLANREITVMADKSLPYDILKKVMATCTRLTRIARPYQPGACGNSRPRAMRSSAKKAVATTIMASVGRARSNMGSIGLDAILSWSYPGRRGGACLDKADPPCAFRPPHIQT